MILFQGVIEVTESPVNKFQLLINVTHNVHSNEKVNYHLRHAEDSVFVELLPRHTPSRTVVPGGDEEKIYMQLLFVTVASLVLVVFVVSIIFSCWWLKSQKLPYQAKTTDPVYYIALPQEGMNQLRTNRPSQRFLQLRENQSSASKASRGLQSRPTVDESELVELLPDHGHIETKSFKSEQPTAQFYISTTTAYATLSLSSNSDLLFHGAPGACPTSYPLPRYVVAGGNGGLNTSVTYGSLNSADNTTVLGTPILISPNSVAAGVDGLFSQRSDGPSVAYVKLAAVAPSPIPGAERQTQQTTLVEVCVPSSGRSQPDAHRSLRMRTLPGKRHVAKEFLDESVVATMTRSRFKGRQTTVSSATSVQPDSLTLTTTTTASVFSLQSPIVLLRSEQPISGSSLANDGTVRAVLPAVSAGLFPAVSAPGTGGLRPGHGSDETSGILSDSDGSTNLVSAHDAVLSSALLLPATIPLAGSEMASRTVFLILTQQLSPTALPLSVLTGMSNAVGAATFVPSALLAEMAACPQHSYLVRSQQTDVFPEQPNLTSSAELSSSQTSTTRATVDIQQICGSLKHSSNQPVSCPSATATPLISATTITTSSDPVSVVSGAKFSVLDEYALGSGEGIPDVPNLFRERFSPQRGSDDTTAIPDDRSSTLGRSRFGPNPPKRSVSLATKQIAFSSAENDVVDSVTVSQGRTSALNASRETQPIFGGEYKCATLGRTPTNGIASTEEDSDASLMFAPGSSATLPSGGTNPRSALKSADRSGPKVSKHLRFTTLTLLTLLWLLVAIVLGSPELNTPTDRRRSDPDPVVRWNVIAAPLLHAEPMPKDDDLSNPSPEVRLTIWLPSDMIPKGDSVRASHAGERRTPQADGRRALNSIQLWLNASSRIEVRLGSPIERDAIHIYDVVNAHQILGTRVCRQRYACEHSCDPGARHDCICQRGYRPAGPKDRERLLAHGNRLGNIDLENVKGRICLDVDECASTEIRAACSRLGGVCTNRPGDYACLCPSGKPCLDCDATCPQGFWAFGDCGRNQSIECRRKSLIPELIVPYKKNVWFENLQMVRDVVVTLTPDDLGRLPLNKSIVLDRSSGYQVRLDFDSLNLLPVLGPVDHSSGNDNSLFLASAAALDRTVAEPDAYRWSSATGQYHTVHAYTLKANNTLAKLCPYPVPPLYSLGIRAHRNVTTATVPDTSLPGHRPVLAGCRTYRRHGYFPPVEPESRDHQIKNIDNDKTSNYPYGIDRDNVYTGEHHGGEPTAPVVACLEPSRLPAIFGSQWNAELASPRAVYYEEKQLCGQLKSDCQNCLAACAEELKSSSLTCKPTSNPADNGRSPRLEICFDCCARDNCTDVCSKYSAHRCHMQLCNYGLRLDFPLTPEWPKQGEFLCHVQPSPSRPIYRLHWSLLYQGRPLTPDRFPAALLLPVTNTEQASSVQDSSLLSQLPISHSQQTPGSERWSIGHGGQLNQVYRGLLNIQYTSGLEHLPDMVGGTDTMQSAYFWSKQTIPLVSGSAVNAAFDPVSSAATGAMYANTMHSVSSTELTSIQVWPSQPLGVSTAAWARLSGAPCAAADPLLEQLNLYTSALPPYIAMAETKLTLSLPKSSSLLGAVFSPASVERGQYLRASLALAWVAEDSLGTDESTLGSELKSHRPRTSDQTVAGRTNVDLSRSRYWVIDLTGQVDQFPGLFRLRVFPDNEEDSSKESSGPNTNPPSSVRVFDYAQADVDSAEATVEVEGEGAFSDAADEVGSSEEPDEVPLADYDVGVFEERKFQLRILIPGPEKEPDYSKSFRLVITDAKHRLDIRVKRAVQEPDEMALRRSYERLPDDDIRPALVDLLPSLSARQQAVLQQASAGLLNSETNLDESLPSTVVQQHTEPEWMYFGPPPSVVFSVIMTLILLLIVLFIGFVTQPDPTLAWAKLRSCTKLTDSACGDEDHVALVPNPARHNSLLSRWCRVLLLIGYLCLKSAYTFGVTLTALVIIIRYVTRDPANRLTNIPEWTTGSQNNDFMDTSLTRQKLLQDAMDVHLRGELLRQQQDVKRMRDICDRGVEQMFDRMEEQLSAASKVAATRRSRVLLSQAVAELARVTAVASTLQLADGLMAFNQSAEWALHRLKSDLLETERALGNSEWLTGARIIYSEVVRLRGLTPDPTDPTRSFLQWAKLISPGSPSLEDLVVAGHLPRIEQPSLLPLLQPDHFQIPTPMMRASGSTVDGEEPEYGPQYVPFTSDPVEAEVNEAHWMNYDTDPDVSGGLIFSDVMDSQSSQQQKPSPSETSSTSGADSTDTHAEVAGKLFANVQLGWMHVLGAALLLDAMWLIHRVLHTVDTAERLLYGETMFVDLTAEGLRRRLMRKTRIWGGCKRAFEAAMQPGAVRKLCGSVLALLVVTQGAAHLGRLLSQETLDYIGYYDNLILPVHLHARLVNVHVSRSAQRLNQYEVASLESETSRRLREAQFLLHQWTSWLNDIEQEQCRLLLAYKAAAQQVRTKIAAKLTRNPSLSRVKLPIHVLHNGASQPGSAQTDWTTAALGSGPSISKPVDALVPRHCRLLPSERQIELEDARRLDAPYCPLKAVVPRLFKGYNASHYFDEVVKQSETWLLSARDYFSRTFYCLFIYVSVLILWNTTGSVLWFYLNRFNIIPKKVLFESDVSSWYLSRESNQNL
ncbi:hypothetical protein PHET_03224 [Paragonimus heterotremus]|uniref:EGF-like domain-containing protein n=1 Tax=Paragonimus heterotremus TaxID=100268 RepID=A0A8J4TEY8_9TREM|nr:hypothetical protein PHET_03224 [Paragonimus heterotremus]